VRIVLSAEKLKIFIVDDHQILVDGLKMVIENEDDMILAGTATSGEEALQKLEDTAVNILLLDINLPGMSGIDACIAIKKSFPDIRVIGLSTYDKGSIIRKILKSGASGYVVKSAGSEEVLKAIRIIAAGESYIGSKAHQAIMDELTSPTLKKSDFMPELTRREKQVLKMIADEKTTPQIAKELFISVNTAETHRKNVLHKFNAKNVAGLVRMAFEKGFLT